MITFALGTTSEYKANSVKHILHKLDFECELTLVDVESGVSEQPKSESETRNGAINRAKKALEGADGAHAGLGIEFGYEPYSKFNHMICYACLFTSDNELLTEHSSSLRLPTTLQKNLESDEEISDHVEEIIKKIPTRQAKLAMSAYLFKRRFIYEAVEPILIQYFLKGVIY